MERERRKRKDSTKGTKGGSSREGPGSPAGEASEGLGPQLIEAAAKGRYEAVAELLRKGDGRAAAIINYVDEVRETALYKAVTFNHPHIVALLLQHGADHSIANDLMYTPLHEAAQYGHTECVRLLLDAGADTTGRNHNKMTPYGLALKRNHKKAAKELAKG